MSNHYFLVIRDEQQDVESDDAPEPDTEIEQTR